MNSSFYKFATAIISQPRLISLISVGIIIFSCGIVTIFESYSGYSSSSIKTNIDKFSSSSVTAEAASLNLARSLDKFLFFLNEIGELSELLFLLYFPYRLLFLLFPPEPVTLI